MEKVIHFSLLNKSIPHPLDFSTKKPKLQNGNPNDNNSSSSESNDDEQEKHELDPSLIIKVENDSDRQSTPTSLEMVKEEVTTSSSPVTPKSPSSHLRSILNMRSPAIEGAAVVTAGVVLEHQQQPPMATTPLNLTMPSSSSPIQLTPAFDQKQQQRASILMSADYHHQLWPHSDFSDKASLHSTPPSSSSSKLRRKQSDSDYGDDDDDDEDYGAQSGRSTTTTGSSPASDCSSYGISSPTAAKSPKFGIDKKNGHLRSHHHNGQPLILRNSHSKMSATPKGETKSSMNATSGGGAIITSSPNLVPSSVPLITPIATLANKLSPMQMNFSPFTVFSQRTSGGAGAQLSPMMSQTVPSSTTTLPFQFHSSPTFFPSQLLTIPTTASIIYNNMKSEQIEKSKISPGQIGDFSTASFGNQPMNLHVSGSSGPGANVIHPNGVTGSKPKTTRPFKAYPKDPLTFPTLGLYGVPLNVSTGSQEALIQQQSNLAYAEFRRQMLSNSQGKGKRLNHIQLQQQQSPGLGGVGSLTPVPPSLASPLSQQQQLQMQQFLAESASNEMLNYRLGLIERGALSSGAEDSHSNSDEGFGCSADKTACNNTSSDNGTNKAESVNGCTKLEQQMKDEAYWERRRKNNEAAKRSRDARRAKEDEIAIRASFLEQENLKLRFEVYTLKNEIQKLRCLLYKPSN